MTFVDGTLGEGSGIGDGICVQVVLDQLPYFDQGGRYLLPAFAEGEEFPIESL